MTTSAGERFDIRPISTSEIEEMLGVWSEAGLPVKMKGRDTVENLTKQVVADPDLFIGAFENGRMVGVIVGSDDGRKGWINRLAIVPYARRSGLARTLVKRCEDVLRARGRQILCVLIEEYNDASKVLFTSMGYIREEEIVYYAKRDGEDV